MNKGTVIYVICILLFFGYKFTEIYAPVIPLAQSYFEDLLALPILFMSAQFSIQWLFRRRTNYTISTLNVVIITILFSIYFEGVLPLFDDRFTADVLDVLCYLTGALLFEKAMKDAYPKSATT